MENKVANNALAPTRVRLKTNKCTKNKRWTKEDDELLFSLVKKTDPINWHQIASSFPNKTTQQVTERWEKVLDPDLVKGNWTREEDETIVNFVRDNGCKNWTRLSSLLPGRIGKQCRERWRNHLDPNLNHSNWTNEEDIQLFKLHSQYGNRWVKISSLMPGRSDNSIKNRWNSTLKKIRNPEFKNIGIPIKLQDKIYQMNRKEITAKSDDAKNDAQNGNTNPQQVNVPPMSNQPTETPMPIINPTAPFFTPFKIEPNTLVKELAKPNTENLDASKTGTTESAAETSPRLFQVATSKNTEQKPFVLSNEEKPNGSN